MYLSNNSLHKLDNLIKDFEVAYRSYTVEIIKSNFPTKDSLQSHLTSLLPHLTNSSLLNSTKYKQRIRSILSDFNQHYLTIDSCYSSYLNKTIPEESSVPYLSTVINYIEILFEPYFQKSSLLSGFQTLDFFSLSYELHKVRNTLSHPASSRITLESSKEVLRLIEKILLNIDEKFFWYSPKESLRDLIDVFLDSIIGFPIKINNIGKTALVLEFINEIIKESIDTSNSQNLDFLLFFTAKEEELVFSENKSELRINEIKKQITSYEDFTINLFKYLNISSLSDIAKFKGIIIIDNIETLKDDKEKIIEFIKILPDSIQVILTSREEEIADNKIALKGYENKEIGIKFLTEYIDE